VNFNFMGQPGSAQPVQSSSYQGNFVMDNRNTIPGQYSTIQQGEANRIIDQNVVGLATGNQGGYQEARFIGGSTLVNNGAYQENRYTNVSAGGPIAHTNANYIENQRYVSAGGPVHTNTNYVENQQYTNVSGGPIVHTNTNYIEPQRYTEQTQFVKTTGVAPREEVVVRSSGEAVRPQYNKIYNNQYGERKVAVQDVDPGVKKTCCAPWCWALFGLLGLAGLVLGLLFGLGVIGGNIEGPNLDINGPDLDADLDINGPNVDIDGKLPSVDVDGKLPSGDVDINGGHIGGAIGGAAIAGGAAIGAGSLIGNGDAEVEGQDYTVVEETTILQNNVEGEGQANE